MLLSDLDARVLVWGDETSHKAYTRSRVLHLYVVEIDLREYRSYCNPQRLLELEPATWAELTSFSFSNCEGSYLMLVSLVFKKKCLYIDKSDIFFPNMNDKNCLVDYEIFQVCLW